MPHGNTKHGAINTPAYISWAHMIQRCENPKDAKYPDYGGRGISVCRRWYSFENFLADMGPRPTNTTIHRLDNNKDYEPGNCKWATAKEQAATRRSRVLLDGDLDRIRDLWSSFKATHTSQRAAAYHIAKWLGLNQHTVANVIAGRAWL